MRGWEKILHANGQDKKEGVAILISDKTDFKMKAIKKKQIQNQNFRPKSSVGPCGTFTSAERWIYLLSGSVNMNKFQNAQKNKIK